MLFLLLFRTQAFRSKACRQDPTLITGRHSMCTWVVRVLRFHGNHWDQRQVQRFLSSSIFVSLLVFGEWFSPYLRPIRRTGGIASTHLSFKLTTKDKCPITRKT